MITVLGTNIISSLGFTTEENYAAVKSGISGVTHYSAGTFDLPEAFMASLVDKGRLNDEFSAAFCRDAARHVSTEELTDLEKATIVSVFSANKEAHIDLSSERTVFIVSTTKGNVDLLSHLNSPRGDFGNSPLRGAGGAFLWHTAELIAKFFKNPNTPIVVSNACISGAAAQIVAMRELQTGNYDYAVVAGVDFLSKFIISGFQSFKALSPEPCRPFDKDRCGLNLGEAAAAMIFGKCDMQQSDMRYATEEIGNRKSEIVLLSGAIRNDATHISAPSRTGEGSFRALKYVLDTKLLDKKNPSNSLMSNSLTSKIAFINAHGTATSYNDAMETVAITRAGLADVPVNSLKAYFGHTLGAAGVVESIVSMCALKENLVLKSANFVEQDFENQINISQENHGSDKKYFVKLMSGFGGVNAALLFGRN